MKKIGFKKLISSMLIIAVAFSTFCSTIALQSETVYAGGTAAAICVEYCTINSSYGNGICYEVTDEDKLSQMIDGPESGETLRYYTNNCYHLYIEPKAGTYKVTDIIFPKGYELDDAVLNIYPLSVAVTEEDVKKYKAWASDPNEAGCEEYKIIVPIKKVGATSAVYKKPSLKLTTTYASYGTVISFNPENECDTDLGKMSYKVMYSTKKNGKYKTLTTTDQTRIYITNFENEYPVLKNGKTFYFKVQATKTIGKKKIQSKWSKVKKIKIKR